MRTWQRREVTRLGLQIPAFVGSTPASLFGTVSELAITAEAVGFDSLWVMDHLHQIGYVGAPTDPMLEAYTLLGALSQKTATMRLGAMVTGVTYRNPALLAKAVTTLDVVSAGRAVLGIGAAWNQEEHAAYGFDFPSDAERLERLEEAVLIARSMFDAPVSFFEGRHYRIEGAINNPRPAQERIPVLIGGSGERVTLRLVASHADACNLFGDLATIRRKLAVLDRHCEEVGRDPESVWRTRLGSLLVAETESEARSKAQSLAAARGMDQASLDAMVLWGDPEMIRYKAAEFIDAGLDGLVFNMALAGDVNQVRMAGEALAPLFGGTTLSGGEMLS